MRTCFVTAASQFWKKVAVTLGVLALCALTLGMVQHPTAGPVRWMNGAFDALRQSAERVQHTLDQLRILRELMDWARRSEQRAIKADADASAPKSRRGAAAIAMRAS